MSAPQLSPVSRSSLLASTAAVTMLFGTTVSAPVIAMQPVVEDVASGMLLDEKCSNHPQNQNQTVSHVPKPAALRFIDADKGAVIAMQPAVEDVASGMLLGEKCSNHPQNQNQTVSHVSKPTALRFIDADRDGA